VPPAPTGTPDESAYADAIAVARPGGVVDLISPSGAPLSRIAAFRGREVRDLEWTPDRSELYVSVWRTTGGECSPTEAVAINVRSLKRRDLGTWSDFAFSTDGGQVAAIEERSCGHQTLVVRNLASGAERRLSGRVEGLIGRVMWVPGVDRIVLTKHIGDSVDLLLLDLSTATSVEGTTLLDVKSRTGGETVGGMAYVGNRLIVALVCCLNTTERVRFVERNNATGDVRELLSLANRHAFDLASSPDGKRLAYVSAVNGAQPWESSPDGLWIWDLTGQPVKVADQVEAMAW
jgi:hypothetical protein